MGSFSGLLVLTLCRDVALVVLFTAEWAWPGSFDLDALRRDSALAVITLTALFSLVGFWNARRLARVVDIELPIAGLPAALSGFIIVQPSYIHVGPPRKRGYLDANVRRFNVLRPDMIAMLGD